MSKILWKASDWSTFLTVCLFKCVLKLFEPEDAKLHCFTFLQCAFSYGSSNCLREKMQNHTSCICLTFVQCVFSHGSSKNLDQCRHNHTGCICWTFHHCAFSYVSSNGLPEKMRNHTGCICLTFSHCVFSNVSWPAWIDEKSHWLHLFDFTPLCVIKRLLKSFNFLLLFFVIVRTPRAVSGVVRPWGLGLCRSDGHTCNSTRLNSTNKY